MRKDEALEVVISAGKGAGLITCAVSGLGLATVHQTAFFGLLATGTAVSAPVLVVAAVSGALLFAGGTLAQKKLREKAVRKAFKKMMAGDETSKT